MRIKIWGARGSIPTPIRPEDVREKIVSAILNIAQIENSPFREELIAAIASNKAPASPEIERRQIVQAYLDTLSPLSSTTASGNTPCIEIRSDDDIFIIDAGSGIRNLGLELMTGACGQGQGVIHLFFSHPHWDHIQGFPFFRPAFVPGNKIFIYSVHNIEAALRRQQESLSFPVTLDYMQADRTFIQLEPGQQLEFGDLGISNIRNHHPGDSYSYRFTKGDKTFVYASDAGYPTGTDLRPYLDFFADANVLVFDSQFIQRESDEKEDWGHSSSFVGVEMAQDAHVETLLLYHYDPTFTDTDLEKILDHTLKFQKNQYPTQKPVKVLIAEEGLTFDLSPEQNSQLKQVPGGNVAILKATGIFDEQVVNDLRVQLEELGQESAPPLIIDMAGVEMLQVTGLRALVRLRKELTGSHLALAGPSINVQQLIELAGYIDFFAIYPSVHTALNAMRVRETLNLPGQTLKNRYYIESKIGEGILGTVFKAKDIRLNRPVAVKVLSASFSEEAIEQFLEQGRQVIELEHPNIVSIYECVEEHGVSFMVEELVESKLLCDLIAEAEGQLIPFDLALHLSHDIALGLEYAHSQGVIHGDLKPKNVLLADKIKISDFGLGRLESGRSLLNLDVPLALVSAHYLAPEQVLGHPIDARTDLYALGVIMYELFTGRLPFTGTDEEVLEHHRRSQPVSPRQLNPAIDYSLEHLILKLLDKDPNKRYATARRVRRILESIIPPVSSQDLVHFDRLPLVGRHKPLKQLTKLWAETQQGHGQLVFISGETGIGKTRLTQELAGRATEAIVLTGVSQPDEEQMPYQPFVDALQTHLAGATPGDAVRQVLEEMMRWVPEMYHLIPQPNPHPTEFGPATDPPAGHPSLARTVARATEKTPWLLILDNLHLADPGSLQLLHYLGRHCGQAHLMIVGTYATPSDETNLKKFSQFLANLKDHAPYTSLSLAPLSQSEVKELLEISSGQDVPLDLAAAIFRRTQGNPLFVNEVTSSLVDEGVVSQRDGKWRLSAVVEADLPPDLTEAVMRRFNRLHKETQTLLYQAATLGLAFDFADLQEMSDLSQADALDNLEFALERQLIRVVAHRGGLRFKHPQIRHILYNNLGQLRRRLMHREAGEALERRRADTGVKAGVLAHHFWQAEVLNKALTYSKQAARQAEIIYAGDTALFWYNRTLDILAQLGDDEETAREKFELLLARERVYSRMGQRKAQAADLLALQALVQEDSARQATVHNRRAAYERIAGRLAQATLEAESAQIAAQQAKDAVQEGESLIQLGYITLAQGDFYAARQYFDRAAQIADETNQRAEARAMNGLATTFTRLHQYAQAEDTFQRALTMNREIGRWSGQAACLSNLGILYLEVGAYVDTLALLQQALEVNRLIGHRRGEAICLHYLALAHKMLGVYNEAETYLKSALAIRHDIEDMQGKAEDMRALGLIELDRKDYAKAREYIGQALEIFQSLKIGAFEGDTWLVLGLALEGLDEPVKAHHAYKQARLLHEEILNQAGVIEAGAGIARCLLAEENIEQAKTEIDACLAWIEPHGGLGIHDPVQLYLTAHRVLAAAGDTNGAAQAAAAGQTFIQHRAEKILDLGLRASYLENVPANKLLLNTNNQS